MNRSSIYLIAFTVIIATAQQSIGASLDSAQPAIKATPDACAPQSETFTVSANKAWSDTGIHLMPMQQVTFSAQGTITVGAIDPVNNFESPAGRGIVTDNGYRCSVGAAPLPTPFPAANLPCWSLIGKIGEKGEIFEVGTFSEIKAKAAGVLYLGVNDDDVTDNAGQWSVKIHLSGCQDR
jgi:hypothetical protein